MYATATILPDEVDMSLDTDESVLIDAARQGDTNAFGTLYQQHAGRVYGLCLRMTANPADAQDCAQDAFIQAWQKLDGFRADAAFGTWIHRIAVNTVLAKQRKSGREGRHLELVARDEPVVQDGIEDVTDIENALHRLPAGARNVFVLYAVYGYTHEEAADMLGIASGTSKAQLHRARKLLTAGLDTGEAG
jgi:RNA polymerase sigma-70 factor (ECF subfamily)